MLRKILTGIALSVLFSASAQAQSTWVEGEHYEVIAEKASAKPQVKEVFSFWCPHCFTFEPVAQQLEKSLPAGVSFKKAHVNFMGGVDRETQDAATLAMIAAKAMKADEVFNDTLFKAIHRERKNIQGMDGIMALFSDAGGDAKRLEKMTKSFGIKGQVKRNNEYIHGIRRVPAFIVNDKFKVNFSSRDMTPEKFVELVIWLTKQQ